MAISCSRAKWAFHYDIFGDEDDDETGYRFSSERFVVGERNVFPFSNMTTRCAPSRLFPSPMPDGIFAARYKL
ncbi:MAG: hypothetical protein R3D29_16630 [Nitratireductor sp.]